MRNSRENACGICGVCVQDVTVQKQSCAEIAGIPTTKRDSYAKVPHESPTFLTFVSSLSDVLPVPPIAQECSQYGPHRVPALELDHRGGNVENLRNVLRSRRQVCAVLIGSDSEDEPEEEAFC